MSEIIRKSSSLLHDQAAICDISILDSSQYLYYFVRLSFYLELIVISLYCNNSIIVYYLICDIVVLILVYQKCQIDTFRIVHYTIAARYLFKNSYTAVLIKLIKTCIWYCQS